MPFGPLIRPSLGLSLLQPQVAARGLTCRSDVLHARVRRADRRAQYTARSRTQLRAFTRDVRRRVDLLARARTTGTPRRRALYRREVLLQPPSWLGRTNAAAADRRLRSAGGIAARAGATGTSIGAPTGRREQPRDRRLHQRLPAAPGLARAGQAPQGAAARHASSSWAAPTAKATMGVETVRQFAVRRRRGLGRGDEVFAELAARVVAARRSAGSPGVITAARRRGTSPVRARRRRRRPCTDLDALPYPDYTRLLRAVRAQPVRATTGSRACSSRRRAAAGGASGCTAPSAASTARRWRSAASRRRARSTS